METQILQKLEGAVSNVGNVKNITSFAAEGSANLQIEFQIGTPIDRATTDVRDAVARVRPDLPQGIQEPQVQRLDIDGGPIVYYAISTTSMSEEQLSWFVDDTISKRLLADSGCGAGEHAQGASHGEIRVDLDPARMESYRHYRGGGQPAASPGEPRCGRRARARWAVPSNPSGSWAVRTAPCS
jgi:multidrug efflux pump subunit AcrB